MYVEESEISCAFLFSLLSNEVYLKYVTFYALNFLCWRYVFISGELEEATDVVRSTQSFYCYDLEEKIIDLTGPIQRKAQTIRAMIPVNWKPYLTAGIIDKDDYAFISVFQKATRIEEREKLLNESQVYIFVYFVDRELLVKTQRSGSL